MHQNGQLPRAVGYTQRFTEADAFGHAVLGAELDYMPMPGVQYASTHRVLKMGSVVLQHVEDAPHFVRGAMDEGVMALLLLLRTPRALPLVNGVETNNGDIALVPGGVEFVASAKTFQTWAALTVTRARLAELAEVAPLPICADGSVRLLRLPADCAATLAAAVQSTVSLVDHGEADLARPGCAEGLAISLNDLLAEALTAGAVLHSTPRATKAALQVVRGAEAFLQANISRPIYTEELCGALAVSARRLHDAFMACFGISPHRYLRARRLTLARRALKETPDRSGLVKSVALLHGFWHLGRFAQDYRDQFGETPTQTLATAHGGRMPNHAKPA